MLRLSVFRSTVFHCLAVTTLTSSIIVVCVAAAAAAVPAQAERPNIILLMGDDHGWDETGYNGHPYLQTPVLDEMAANGLQLNRFYSAHPSCSPTRGSVMTGRHPNRYGTFSPNYSIRPEEITIARLLSEAGYACGHFGKWHLGPVKAASPTNPGAMGFDEWLSHDNFFELNPWLSRNGADPEQFVGESSEVVIQATIEFLQRARQDQQPFFAVVWFGSPHEPYSGLPEDLALYDQLPQLYADQQTRLTSNETGEPTTRPLGEVLQERYAEITAMDRSIGQLRQWLRTADLSDDTLLWYCGDNGTPGDGIVTSPFRGQKGNMYEGGVRVPGIIEWPKQIRSGRVSDLNSVTSDILPTLCELASVQLPQRPLDGISLQPLIANQPVERSEPICFWSYKAGSDRDHQPWLPEDLQQGTTPLVKKMGNQFTRTFRNYHHPQISEPDYAGERVILSGDWKLVVDGSGPTSAAVQLFNLSEDPAESSNLATRHPDRVQQLQQDLRTWQTSVLTSLTGADYKQQ